MIRVVFTGGKTGGHIFPAIAMATEFRNRHPRSRIGFVGTKDGMEAKVVPRYGFELQFIPARGLARKSYGANLTLGYYLLVGLWRSLRILNKKKPHLVVGTGGHVSVPVVLLASLMKVPVMIQEQNSYPGISTRFLACFADRVCLSYPDSSSYFPVGSKFRVIGNPVRPDVTRGNRMEALRAFGLDQGKKTIFVFGGSQGAHAINRALLECLDSFKPEWQVLWQTGERDLSEVSQKTKASPVRCASHPFIQDMKSAYAVADLVISRAGALTLAEITACGKPSILIPYPFAAADHQMHNAMTMHEAGAATVILERDLTKARLCEEVFSLLSDERALRRMADASRKLGRPDAASRLVDEMEDLLKTKTKSISPARSGPGGFRLGPSPGKRNTVK
jgi:UDP-N-acetylglucosamine--N-acetylmuramyl-(pentapeptide) pyrophosphoryl-undecaprenol N-acetylglucosamine transferase